MRGGTGIDDRGGLAAPWRAAFARCAAIVAAIAIVGCFHLPALGPSSRADGFRAVRSAHFVLQTDLGAEAAQDAIADFEATWTALHDVAFSGSRGGAPPVTVVLFSREADLRAVEPCGVRGAFYARLPHDLDDEPTIVLGGELDDRLRRAFAHELTHAFARRAWGALPPWFNEGLAELLSGIELEPDGTAIVGRAPGTSRVCTVPPVPDLLAADRSRFYTAARYGDPSLEGAWREQGYYAGASALVSMLLTDPAHRPRGQRLLQALDRGEPFSHAWRDAFGDVTASLDEELRTSLRRGGSWPLAIPTRARAGGPVPTTERALGCAEAHLLFVRLMPWEGAPGERAKGELEAARTAAPESRAVAYYSALFALARDRHEEAERLLLDALHEAPTDAPLTHALATTYASLLATEPTARVRAKLASAIERLRRVATTAAELELVASYDASIGRIDEGLTYARRALAADPASWRALETYAGLLHQAGRLAEAVRAQERAIAALPDGIDSAVLSVGLEQYREEARRRGAASAP